MKILTKKDGYYRGGGVFWMKTPGGLKCKFLKFYVKFHPHLYLEYSHN